MKPSKSLIVSFLLMSSEALACTELSYPRSENFAMADHVLLAKVISTKLVRDGKELGDYTPEYVEIAYETIETFKGNESPAIAREVVENSTLCSHLPVTPGRDYFLFLSGEARKIVAAGKEGSHPFIDADFQREELLELRTLRDESAGRK